MALVEEAWVAVVGYEGWYEVSSHGRVRRIMPGQGARLGQCRRQKVDKLGYHHVALLRNKVRKDVTVHSIVAAAFIGPRPEGFQINHKNLDKADNRPGNLEYVTGRENVRHAAANGAMGTFGERNGSAKLDREKVRAIRREFAAGGVSKSMLARRYGVTTRSIALAISGGTWGPP